MIHFVSYVGRHLFLVLKGAGAVAQAIAYNFLAEVL